MSSSLLPAIFGGNNRRNKNEKEVAVISNNVKRLNQDAKKMGAALVTLNNNCTLIQRTLTDIKEMNFEKPRAFIEQLDLEEEYKQELIKELEGTKEQAIKELEPIRDASEKIRGNMAVSMVKYQMMTRTLGIQKNVIESGTVQVEAIKQAQELGGLSSDKINELVSQAEEINNVTRAAVDQWDHDATAIKSTLNTLGSNSKDFDVFNIS